MQKFASTCMYSEYGNRITPRRSMT
uniref:Uncharacterized protein n=1 Tax=Anguilla anguilla TaxID=7936 RepID=A0A0E9RV32_ANGAN